MKKYGLFIFACGMIVAGALFFYTVKAPSGEQTPLDTYVYPINTESKEWVELHSLKEKVEAVQIPENVIKTISDAGLIETILQFPLLNLDAYNTEEIACQHLSSQCNGVAELLIIEHAGTALRKAYEEETEQLRVRVLKLLLSRPEIQAKLNDIEAEKVKEILKKKDHRR